MKDILKAVVFGCLFAVPFLTLYVENDYFFPFITGKNFGFRIIVDIAFAAWIILALYDVKYRPKFSGIFWSFSALLVVMFFANLFGVHPRSSFWSNFERMDGYVSLVHTFMYMLMLGSMLQSKKHWNYLLNTSLLVSFAVALYGLAQYGGLVEGTTRIESRLGNAAYMAIYMLFHIFVAFWLFVETKDIYKKIGYILMAAMFTFVLVETGTRGTAVGLAVGVTVMSGYIGLFGVQFKEYRKYAIGGFVLLIIAVSAFVLGRDTEIVQSNQNLARIANISLDDLTIRATIWGMAWDGVKERPVLGYGQSNFNYVFNQNYDPGLYAQEQWFDRSHNIFMDWLVTGGFLGLIAYLSIFGWCAYYLFVRPIINKDDETFTVMERGVLLGILAGYFTHNLVVFDNIISYIFFAMMLGLIHSRVGVMSPAVSKFKLDQVIINQVAVPVMSVLLISSFYFFHLPGMLAAADIIDAFVERDPNMRLAEFKSAIERDSFAHQEITEQLSQQTIGVVRDPNLPQEVKLAFANYTEEQLMRLVAEKPGDARIHVFIGTYYRSINQIDKAAEQMAIARSLSPNKQAIIHQQAFIELSRGNNEVARDMLKESYELDTRNLEAKEYYAASLFYVPGEITPRDLMNDEATKFRFAKSDFIISSATQANDFDFVAMMYQYRVDQEPDARQNWRNTPQNWASLAYAYYRNGDKENALRVLEESKTVVPTMNDLATCVSDNIENNREPDEGC